MTVAVLRVCTRWSRHSHVAQPLVLRACLQRALDLNPTCVNTAAYLSKLLADAFGLRWAFVILFDLIALTAPESNLRGEAVLSDVKNIDDEQAMNEPQRRTDMMSCFLGMCELLLSCKVYRIACQKLAGLLWQSTVTAGPDPT